MFMQNSYLPLNIISICINILFFSLNAQMQKCRIGSMRGNHPSILCSAVNQLKQQKNEIEHVILPSKPLNNLILLYGSPGNGKTTYAKEIALETNSHFLELPATRIVDPYLGNGPKNIAN